MHKYNDCNDTFQSSIISIFSSVCRFVSKFLFLYFYSLFYDSFFSLQFYSWHPLCLCFMLYDFSSLSFSSLFLFLFFLVESFKLSYLFLSATVCVGFFFWVDSLVAFNFLHNKYFFLTFHRPPTYRNDYYLLLFFIIKFGLVFKRKSFRF